VALPFLDKLMTAAQVGHGDAEYEKLYPPPAE
jgi:hypothetical protein